jgi:hypothetical protein
MGRLIQVFGTCLSTHVHLFLSNGMKILIYWEKLIFFSYVRTTVCMISECRKLYVNQCFFCDFRHLGTVSQSYNVSNITPMTQFSHGLYYQIYIRWKNTYVFLISICVAENWAILRIYDLTTISYEQILCFSLLHNGIIVICVATQWCKKFAFQSLIFFKFLITFFQFKVYHVPVQTFRWSLSVFGTM